MANLVEAYKGRIAVSEKYFAQNNAGAKLDATKKMLVAQCLDNTAKFINESFENAVGTQRSDLGTYKKFCLDITTLTVPNLVVNDLFMVKPMASFTGYLTYMNYGLGNIKGESGGVDEDGYFRDTIQDPFVVSKMTESRARYTGEAVVEAATAGTDAQALAWLVDGDLVHGAFPVTASGVTTNYDVKLVKSGAADIYAFYKAADKKFYSDAACTSQITVAADTKVAYKYDNQIVPQDKLPTLVGKMQGIALTARARRIAIQYSQFAAFVSKNDYGIDFEGTIAQQAQAELSYEIDSEAVFMIKDAADAKFTDAEHGLITWVDEELDTISYAMKAEGFARKLEQAKALVYKTTQKFMPNWILVSPDVMPILTFVPGFELKANAIANGPYVAGTVAGMKVIVSPALGDKVCYLGVLGNDGKSAVGVYAPYMPIVPTQLIGFADGMMSQGFSTLYDMKILNANLLAKIAITTGNDMAKVQTVEASEI